MSYGCPFIDSFSLLADFRRTAKVNKSNNASGLLIGATWQGVRMTALGGASSSLVYGRCYQWGDDKVMLGWTDPTAARDGAPAEKAGAFCAGPSPVVACAPCAP